MDISREISPSWVGDIHHMYTHYGFHTSMENMDDETRRKHLAFRMDLLKEEVGETLDAFSVGDPEELVDGLVDICVIALGTLDLYDIDAQKAWKSVLRANLQKRVGIKEGRPNPYGLPDLVKPEGWQAPSHEDNHGLFDCIHVNKRQSDSEENEFQGLGRTIGSSI